MGAAEMNAVERVSRTIRGETPDRVPVVALIIHHTMKLAGVGYDRYAIDPRILVDCQIAAWKRYGYDGFHVTSDNWILPEALGCKVELQPDQPPFVRRRVLAQSKDLSLLEKPRIPESGRMWLKTEATRLAAEQVGDRCYLKTCTDQGPFSLATAVRGIDRLMLDLYDDEQFVFDLLEICTQIIIDFNRAVAQCGCHSLTFGDSTAGLLSRDLFAKFAYPFEKEVMTALADLDMPVFLHICGDTSHIIDYMVDTGAQGLEVDYQNDIAFYKDKAGTRACLQGNIEPTGVMLKGFPEEVREACRKAIEEGKPGGRFILSAGCEIPRDTPPENIQAMVQAARDYGIY